MTPIDVSNESKSIRNACTFYYVLIVKLSSISQVFSFNIQLMSLKIKCSSISFLKNFGKSNFFYKFQLINVIFRPHKCVLLLFRNRTNDHTKKNKIINKWSNSVIRTFLHCLAYKYYIRISHIIHSILHLFCCKV